MYGMKEIVNHIGKNEQMNYVLTQFEICTRRLIIAFVGIYPYTDVRFKRQFALFANQLVYNMNWKTSLHDRLNWELCTCFCLLKRNKGFRMITVLHVIWYLFIFCPMLMVLIYSQSGIYHLLNNIYLLSKPSFGSWPESIVMVYTQAKITISFVGKDRAPLN